MPEEKGKTAEKGGDSNLFGALCYIIGVLVPLFVLFTDKKNDKFLAFHAWQSLFYTVVTIVYSVALMVFAGVLVALLGPLACIVMPLNFLPMLGLLFLAVKAYQGEKYKFPVIGGMAEGRV